MIKNMLFWHRQATDLEQQFSNLVIENGDPEQTAAAIKLLRELLACKQHSQECAVDAAPYCHAKLHNISAAPVKPEPLTIDNVPADPVEASRVYQQLVGGGR